MRSIILAGLIVFAFAASAGADEKFTQMDKDGNGQVTWEEFQAVYPNMKRPAFEAVDTDKSNGISHEEWDAFRSGHAGARASGGMGGGMGGTMPIKPLPKDGTPDAPQEELPLIRPPK